MIRNLTVLSVFALSLFAAPQAKISIVKISECQENCQYIVKMPECQENCPYIVKMPECQENCPYIN